MTPLHVTVRRRGPVWRWSIDTIHEATGGKVRRAPHSAGWGWTRRASAIAAGEALADAQARVLARVHALLDTAEREAPCQP